MCLKLNTDNVAYTEEYRKVRMDEEMCLYNSTAFKDEKYCKLTDTLTRIIKNYERNTEHPGMFSCSMNELVNSSGIILYSYSCVDNSADFCSVITHKNGKEYIVFRRDLYGYSVLDLSTMNDFHYIPAESFGFHGETFIWCNIHYNPLNNILAVEGCFWACPYSVLLVDFSNPMQEATQIYVNDYINKNFEKYDDIDFVAWDNNDLLLHGTDNGEYVLDTNQITIKQEEYMKWFEPAV